MGSPSPGYSAASHETQVWMASPLGRVRAPSGGVTEGSFSLHTDPRIGEQEFLPLENWIPELLVLLLFKTQCKLQRNRDHGSVFLQVRMPPSSDHRMWCQVLLTQVQDSHLSLPLFACSSGLPRSASKSCLWAWQLLSPVLCPCC